jgi:hypothetical protein
VGRHPAGELDSDASLAEQQTRTIEVALPDSYTLRSFGDITRSC